MVISDIKKIITGLSSQENEIKNENIINADSNKYEFQTEITMIHRYVGGDFKYGELWDYNLELIDKEISKERLLEVQKYLFNHQLKMNESLINKSIDVLIENKIDGQNKLFGRNKYMNAVFFDGKVENIGKILKIKIDKGNQNSLLGKIETNNKKRAA